MFICSLNSTCFIDICRLFPSFICDSIKIFQISFQRESEINVLSAALSNKFVCFYWTNFSLNIWLYPFLNWDLLICKINAYHENSNNLLCFWNRQIDLQLFWKCFVTFYFLETLPYWHNSEICLTSITSRKQMLTSACAQRHISDSLIARLLNHHLLISSSTRCVNK